MDGLGWRREGFPFLLIGMNPLVIYLLVNTWLMGPASLGPQFAIFNFQLAIFNEWACALSHSNEAAWAATGIEKCQLKIENLKLDGGGEEGGLAITHK